MSAAVALLSTLAIGLSSTPPLLHRPVRRSPAILLCDDDGSGDGEGIFRPYTPGEEDAVEVPDSSRRLFAAVLGIPVLAILLGIATYNPTDEELRDELVRKATRLRGGGGGAATAAADLLVSVAVLVAVSMAAHSGSGLMAAVFSTAPTGVPLSLWLVHRAAASSAAGGAALETFLRACIKGTVALACFCLGALACVRRSDGAPPSLALLLVAGFGSWAAAWLALRRVT